MALRLLRRRDWAEDVLQESFVAAWRHAARFDRSKGAAMTWLIRIVRNEAFDRLYRYRHDGPPLPDVDGDDSFGATNVLALPDSAELIDYTRRARRVADCMARLEPPQRQSIALVFFRGLSHGELAAHLRQPLGTVKAWVRRGLQRLKDCLGD